MRLRAFAFHRPSLDYGLSTLGKSLPWASADVFTLYFLTDIAGLPAIRAGFFVLAYYLWNAACDPAIGWLLERSPELAASKIYRISGTVAAAFCLVLSFTGIGPASAPLALLLSGLAFRTAYSAVDVPHNAILARLSRPGMAPVGLAAVRELAGLTAALAVTYASEPVLHASGSRSAEVYLIYTVGVAVVGAILFLGFYPEPTRSLPRGEAIADSLVRIPEHSPLGIAFSYFLLTVVVGALMAGVFTKDLVYIAKYVFADPGWTADALVFMLLGRLAGVPLWWLLPKRVGVIRGMATSYGLVLAAGAIMAASPPFKPLFAAGLFATGLGLGGVNALTWAMAANLAKLLSPLDRKGDPRFFGMFTAVTKVANGVSGLLLGILLAGVGLDKTGNIATAVSDDFYRFACSIPVAGAFVGLLCLAGLAVATRGISSA